jgi:hypothetical protein
MIQPMGELRQFISDQQDALARESVRVAAMEAQVLLLRKKLDNAQRKLGVIVIQVVLEEEAAKPRFLRRA